MSEKSLPSLLIRNKQMGGESNNYSHPNNFTVIQYDQKLLL